MRIVFAGFFFEDFELLTSAIELKIYFPRQEINSTLFFISLVTSVIRVAPFLFALSMGGHHRYKYRECQKEQSSYNCFFVSLKNEKKTT